MRLARRRHDQPRAQQLAASRDVPHPLIGNQERVPEAHEQQPSIGHDEHAVMAGRDAGRHVEHALALIVQLGEPIEQGLRLRDPQALDPGRREPALGELRLRLARRAHRVHLPGGLVDRPGELPQDLLVTFRAGDQLPPIGPLDDEIHAGRVPRPVGDLGSHRGDQREGPCGRAQAIVVQDEAAAVGGDRARRAGDVEVALRPGPRRGRRTSPPAAAPAARPGSRRDRCPGPPGARAPPSRAPCACVGWRRTASRPPRP